MHTVTVTMTAEGELHVYAPPVGTTVPAATTTVPGETTTTVAEKAEDTGPKPIAPETKELAWGAGSFIVLFVLMRVFLFPKVKKGMDARYGKIRGDHESADAMRLAARQEVAEYEADVAAAKASAARKVDAARQTLEGERTAAIAELNARLTARRNDAAAANEAARAAASTHIRDAVADVSTRAAELATGKRPDPAVVQRTVDELMAGGAR